MIIEFKCGNLLTTNAKLICHQVNCRGVMGAGVAKAIKVAHPDAFYEYKEYCSINAYDGRKLLGDTLFAKSNGKVVANMFAQDGYSFYGIHTCYGALKVCFGAVYKYAQDCGIPRVAFPFGIGCGLGGGDWQTVFNLLQFDVPVTVELWMLNPTPNLFGVNNAKVIVDNVENGIIRGEFEGCRFIAPQSLMCECKSGDVLRYSDESGTWYVDSLCREEREREIDSLWGRLNIKN